MMEEIWKNIKGYEGRYKISNLGRVLSLKNGCHKEDIIKSIRTACDGYSTVALYTDDKGKMMKVHRLIAVAFIENPLNKPDVNHKNGIKTDNRVENLEWCTKKENTQHAIKNNLFKNIGSKAFKAKLKESDVLEIIEIGKQRKRPSYRAIGEKYGVSLDAIFLIIKGKNWKQIPRETHHAQS
jgi:hypothetical protein